MAWGEEESSRRRRSDAAASRARASEKRREETDCRSCSWMQVTSCCAGASADGSDDNAETDAGVRPSLCHRLLLNEACARQAGCAAAAAVRLRIIAAREKPPWQQSAASKGGPRAAAAARTHEAGSVCDGRVTYQLLQQQQQQRQQTPRKFDWLIAARCRMTRLPSASTQQLLQHEQMTKLTGGGAGEGGIAIRCKRRQRQQQQQHHHQQPHVADLQQEQPCEMSICCNLRRRLRQAEGVLYCGGGGGGGFRGECGG